MNIDLQALKRTSSALLASLLVLGFETLYFLTSEPLTGYPWKQPTADDAVVAAKYALATQDNHYDVAFVGDSSCLRGVVPEQFERESGLTALNLCTHKMHSIAGYALLAARVAKAHPELRAVVMVVTPETLGSRKSRVDDYGALGKHLVAYGDEGLGFSATFADYRNWFLARHAWRDFPLQFGGSYSRLLALLVQNKGYLPENMPAQMLDSGALREFRLENWQLQWLASLDALFQQFGKQILLALSPISASASSPSYRQNAEQAMNQLADRYTSVEIIRARSPEYPASAFASTAHLRPEWAYDNTRDLIPKILAALD